MSAKYLYSAFVLALTVYMVVNHGAWWFLLPLLAAVIPGL